MYKKGGIYMTKNSISKYYYIQIFKSLLTAIACLYLAKFDDIRNFSCILGFLASVMTVSWIRDFFNARNSNKNQDDI